MGQERRTSHEEDRECRQPDVGHRVVAVTPWPFALVGKTGADLVQPPDQLLNRAHLVQESVIESQHKRKLLYDAGGGHEIHNMWHLRLRSSLEATKSATHSRLELLCAKCAPGAADRDAA